MTKETLEEDIKNCIKGMNVDSNGLCRKVANASKYMDFHAMPNTKNTALLLKYGENTGKCGTYRAEICKLLRDSNDRLSKITALASTMDDKGRKIFPGLTESQQLDIERAKAVNNVASDFIGHMDVYLMLCGETARICAIDSQKNSMN